MRSQNLEILEHLQKGKRLTASYAANHFRCWRLAARIHELRQQGHRISSETIKRRSKRSGQMVAFAAYFMEGS